MPTPVQENQIMETLSNHRTPEMIGQQLDRIESMLLTAKDVLNIHDVALLTGLSRSHLYKLTCAHAIPYYKPHGKHLYFSRKEIEEWMLQNRHNTTLEAEQQAAKYLVENDNKKRKETK